MAKTIKKCIICGKEFEPMKASQKTCSKECRDKKNREYARNSNEQRKHLEVIKCIVCGKEFKQTHGSQKICSDECKKVYSKLRQHEFQIRHKKPLEAQKCYECGKEFIPSRNGALTCSQKCSKARTKRLAKEKRKEKTKVNNNKRSYKKKEKSMNEILISAMAEHMTYGQYVAKYGL